MTMSAAAARAAKIKTDKRVVAGQLPTWSRLFIPRPLPAAKFHVLPEVKTRAEAYARQMWLIKHGRHGSADRSSLLEFARVRDAELQLFHGLELTGLRGGEIKLPHGETLSWSLIARDNLVLQYTVPGENTRFYQINLFMPVLHTSLIYYEQTSSGVVEHDNCPEDIAEANKDEHWLFLATKKNFQLTKLANDLLAEAILAAEGDPQQQHCLMLLINLIYIREAVAHRLAFAERPSRFDPTLPAVI